MVRRKAEQAEGFFMTARFTFTSSAIAMRL